MLSNLLSILFFYTFRKLNFDDDFLNKLDFSRVATQLQDGLEFTLRVFDKCSVIPSGGFLCSIIFKDMSLKIIIFKNSGASFPTAFR